MCVEKNESLYAYGGRVESTPYTSPYLTTFYK